MMLLIYAITEVEHLREDSTSTMIYWSTSETSMEDGGQDRIARDSKRQQQEASAGSGHSGDQADTPTSTRCCCRKLTSSHTESFPGWWRLPQAPGCRFLMAPSPFSLHQDGHGPRPEEADGEAPRTDSKPLCRHLNNVFVHLGNEGGEGLGAHHSRRELCHRREMTSTETHQSTPASCTG